MHDAAARSEVNACVKISLLEQERAMRARQTAPPETSRLQIEGPCFAGYPPAVEEFWGVMEGRRKTTVHKEGLEAER